MHEKEFPKCDDAYLILSNDPDSIVSELVSRGWPFEKGPSFIEEDGHVASTYVESQIESDLIRLACKVAFNFLARKLGREIALRQEFDEIRNYVRYGTPRSKVIVELTDGVSLHQRVFAGSRYGFFVGLQILPKGQVLGIVSMQNTLSYLLTLGKLADGPRTPYLDFCFFDVETRTVFARERNLVGSFLL